MGELGSGSGSSFPGTLDTDATLEVASPSAGKTLVRANSMNDVNAAVIAIETELGTDPAGTLTDVKTYLQIEHNTNGTQKISSYYAADAEASDTYVITLTPAPTVYTTGMRLWFKANTLNTGAATINANALGAKTIVKQGGFTLIDGDIRAGYIYELVYDGTNFIIMNPSRPFMEHQSAKNSGSVTIDVGGENVVSITFNNVNIGDRILVHGELYNILVNTSNHYTTIEVTKTAGTSSGNFYNSTDVNPRAEGNLTTAGNRTFISISGIWTVTVAGTLTLTLQGQSSGDTTTVDANKGQIDGLLLG